MAAEHPHSHRPLFTPSQLHDYFSHISLPHPSSTPLPSPTLSFLQKLQTHHLLTVPFENVSLHYSARPLTAPSLQPADLFHKLVVRGHGGYCMEVNCFFGTVLRSLGYRVLSVGARVSDFAMGPRDDVKEVGYTGWCVSHPHLSPWHAHAHTHRSHMINVVTIDDRRYVVDVGFGANNPMQPLEWVEGQVTPAVAPAFNRLVRANIPANTDAAQRLWIYEHKDDGAVGGEEGWLPMYCFAETEFGPMDYEVMNFFTSCHPTSFFAHLVLCCRGVEGEEREGEKTVGGMLMLVGAEVTRRVGGKKERLMVCETEAERVEALEKWFGVRLTEEERAGVKGREVELGKKEQN